ncbi:MAG: threonine--tRNA ligase [Nanoarchaeota archaeon]|nr:threonine--tRNA ligase [Nanoarchaeota archaeon]
MEKKQEVSEALKAEEKIESKWYILDLDGNLHEIKEEKGDVVGFDFSKYPNLLKFARYEIAKRRVYEREPPHVGLMKKLELVDYEKGSDLGNLRYYPKGRFVKRMLETFVSKKLSEYAMEVETPIMYDYNHPSLKKYLHRFPARQYVVESSGKRSFFLRFAACFGQFLMAHDMNISYKHLPLRLYELTRYSFRLEQSGELVGLKRLRAFTMPDCHAFVKDYEQGKEEMLRRFELSKEVMKGIGFKLPDDFELGIRFVKDFYEEHKDFAKEIVNRWGKPALIEMWDKRFFYFSMKYEWNFIDAMEKATALVTDQFDVENAERYEIYYVDKDNQKKHPLILHLSPSGAIERVMYSLLEKAWMDEQNGKAGMLPVWLSPEQVRLLPVADRHMEFVEKIAGQLEDAGIRVSIDDRDLSIPKKVFQAKQAWVPYIVVIGDKEMESNKLPVVVREESEPKKDKIENMDVSALIDLIKSKVGDMPSWPLPVPKYMSKQPIFYARK